MRFQKNGSNSAVVTTALTLLGLICLSAWAQIQTRQESPARSQVPMATAGVHAANLDSENKPVTAGGTVDDGPIVFVDTAQKAGLTSWKHVMGTPQRKFILETVGSGVALLDYDNDGWLDIYLVNGSTYDAENGKAIPPHAALFHNNHDGTFTDVAALAGVTNDRWGFGVAVGDYDNDGWPDIYVANFGKNRLYHNNHNGTFTDVGEKAGVAIDGWSAGPSWGDYDHDGKLDLFVPGYAKFDPHNPQSCSFLNVKISCGPLGLPGEPDHLFHNNGDGTFTDVSVKAGVADAKGYYGFASTFVDVDDDGWVDLLVANDSRPNYLYRNRHDGTFEDVSYLSGFALTEDGRVMASMGIAVGDYNRDGKLDVYVANFSDDYSVLFRNEGNGIFSDITYQAGLVEPTIPFLKWGTGFLDFDNDGLPDLLVANGHVFPMIDKQNWGTTWAERPQLFRNVDG